VRPPDGDADRGGDSRRKNCFHFPQTDLSGYQDGYDTDGVLRLRYRNSQEKPELANPGNVYHISVDLGATNNVFQIGHKLRLEVSSSNFPRFDRNLNTGGDQALGTRPVKATNIIYHDKSRPSALVLPIVP
jgi:hypothetical protein